MNKTTAIITGAAGGMGLVITERLAQNYELILTDIKQEPLTELVKRYPAAKTVAGSISDPAIIAQIVDALGENTLGAVAHTAGLSPALEADGRRVLDVNLAATARLSDALLPHCAPGTVFVVIASMAGHNGNFSKLFALLDNPLGDGVIDQLAQAGQNASPIAYAMSKAGVIRLVERQAKKWAERGGRIVSISPGLIDTTMGRAEEKASPVLNETIAKQPIARIGTPADIADALEFLISEKAAYITGTDLLVDGGAIALQQTDPEFAKLSQTR